MERLKLALETLGVGCTEQMLTQFADYRELVLSWNEKVNLTAIRDREEFEIKHFIDSILCAAQPEVVSARFVIDVGTGAGFPGLPLAILFPGKQFVLMDSLQKRIHILEKIYRQLGLENVSLVHGRAEDLGRNPAYRERFDLCVSRAVANLSTLAEYCLPFLREGGYFLAYKGPDYDQELRGAQAAVNLLGGRVTGVRKSELLDFELSHQIIYIKKERKTPQRYPRKAGTPSKDPLK